MNYQQEIARLKKENKRLSNLLKEHDCICFQCICDLKMSSCNCIHLKYFPKKNSVLKTLLDNIDV